MRGAFYWWEYAVVTLMVFAIVVLLAFAVVMFVCAAGAA